MPNHLHLLVVPELAISLRLALGEAHRRYSSAINARERWTGHLWQDRFASFPLEGEHYTNAIRYVERNPVRARLVAIPWDYPWSSARARVLGCPDPLLAPDSLAMQTSNWQELLASELLDTDLQAFRSHARTGRPLGSDAFLQHLEAEIGRSLLPQKRGPKPKENVV